MWCKVDNSVRAGKGGDEPPGKVRRVSARHDKKQILLCSYQTGRQREKELRAKFRKVRFVRPQMHRIHA